VQFGQKHKLFLLPTVTKDCVKYAICIHLVSLIAIYTVNYRDYNYGYT